MPRYRAITIANTIAESKKNKTPSVKIQFLTQYDHDSPTLRCAKTFYGDLWLSEKCIDRTMDTLNDVFGWQGDDITELNFKNDALTGVEVDLVTEFEHYADNEGNQKQREEVKFINNPNRTHAKQLDESVLNPIAAALRGKILQYRQKNAGKPAPEIKRSAVAPAVQNEVAAMAAQVGPGPGDEQLPF